MSDIGAHDQQVVAVVVHVDVRRGYALAHSSGKRYRIVRRKLIGQDLPYVGQQISIRLGSDDQGDFVASYELTPLPEKLDSQVAGLARALGENAPSPLAQLAAVVRMLPPATVAAILDEVRRLEGSGGVWRPGGARRVTPGGHFFRLARSRLTPDQQHELDAAAGAKSEGCAK